MQTFNADILIEKADKLLETASAELQKSEEDVTAHLVCYNSRQSIINYLISFLTKNGIEPKNPITMASLMDQCRGEDARFDLIDISEIFCRNDESHEEYCLNVEKVSDCLSIAKQTKEIVKNQSPAF